MATHIEPRPWTGVVLCGGRSTRMGQDKARLPWRGKTLLAHACATLTAAGASGVVVSGDYPEYGGIADATPGLGPLGGVANVFAAVSDRLLLLVPVDMPLISPALLEVLVRQSAATCAAYRDHVLPMSLQVNARSRAVLVRLLSGPPAERSLRALHTALGGEWLEAGPEQRMALVNCNTPAQWQALAT